MFIFKGYSRLPFFEKDSKTVLLYDWYNITTDEMIPENTTLYDHGGLNKNGTIIKNTAQYNKDGSIFFGFENYLLVRLLYYFNFFTELPVIHKLTLINFQR